MATVCPYCNIEVSESLIEAEDGCCPECGAVIGATSSFLADRESDGYDYDDEENDVLSEFDDEDSDDDFARSEYEDDIFADDLDAELDAEFGDEDAFPEDEDFDFDEEESGENEDDEDGEPEEKPKAKPTSRKKRS